MRSQIKHLVAIITIGIFILFGTFLLYLFQSRPANLRTVLEDYSGNTVFFKHPEQLKQHYEKNNYPYIWLKPDGSVFPYTERFVERLKNVHSEGLDMAHYPTDKIDSLYNRIREHSGAHHDADIALLEVLLTDVFCTYVADHYAGRASPENSGRLSRLEEIQPFDSLKNLKEGISFDSLLHTFECPHKAYTKLKEKLTEYLAKSDSASWQIARQIALNMERWRWLPRRFPSSYLMTNIADFSLHLSDQGKDTLHMKIIAGKLDQPTPFFQASLQYLILNPWWEIPHSIATKEMLPQIRKDISYLEQNHIKVYELHKNGGRQLSPYSIEWNRLHAKHFPYRLRQTPGPWNALGRVKFIFPNPYSIYFHDTPFQNLFFETVRTFSHGCIRISRPIELAAYLQQKDTTWINEKLADGQQHVLIVAGSPSVFICYWTAWVDEEGLLILVPDIYGYDKNLLESLTLKPTVPSS